MRILVLGSQGLIGRTIFRVLSDAPSLKVFGVVRCERVHVASQKYSGNIICGVDVLDESKLINAFSYVKPEVVINCVGLTKHKDNGFQPFQTIKINSLYPHFLSQISKIFDARLIHLSTDCVFSGKRGFYSEADVPDADDLYGRSKVLGEVSYGDSLTIRTSTIGHELDSSSGLLNWFLSQNDRCSGYSRAIFSGLPTVVLAEVLRDYVLNNKSIKGLYHIAAEPINKYDLLKLIAKQYNKKIKIEIDDNFEINRSLNSQKFNDITDFHCPDWPNLIEQMHRYQ